MDSKAFDLGEEMETRKVEYTLHTGVWENFKTPNFNLRISKWKKLKYLNISGTNFGSQVSNIPSNKGGLYLFYVKCNILEGITEYPLYLGRAQYTKSQNLRKRVKEYYQKYANMTERPLIHKMFKYWSKNLYIAYYPLNTNTTIKNLERDLINALMLPMNSDVPDKRIKSAIKAFK